MIALFLASLAALVWVGLILFHGRYWQAGPILPPVTKPVPLPRIDIVVPARDEAPSIARSIGSLTRQTLPPGGLRVILVDDGSSDGTAEIAARAAEGAPHPLTILRADPKPPGWSGKLWAVHQGLALADAELTLLTDADIEHAPDHVARLATKAETEDLDLVSEMVLLNCESFAERAFVPAFVYFFQLLYPFAQCADPRHKMAGAAGGTIMIRKRALERMGGIAAVRGALIDDVAVGQAVKRGGGRIWLGHTKQAVSIRLYPHWRDIWDMVARTAYVQLRFSPWLLAGTILGMLLVWLLPPTLALFGHGPARWIALGTWVVMAGSYLPSLRRYGLSALWAPFLPLIALFYMAATIGSAANHMRGRSVTWKNRVYG